MEFATVAAREGRAGVTVASPVAAEALDGDVGDLAAAVGVAGGEACDSV